MSHRRRVLVASYAAVGVSALVLTYAYLDWRRPILPIRFDTGRSTQ